MWQLLRWSKLVEEIQITSLYMLGKHAKVFYFEMQHPWSFDPIPQDVDSCDPPLKKLRPYWCLSPGMGWIHKARGRSSGRVTERPPLKLLEVAVKGSEVFWLPCIVMDTWFGCSSVQNHRRIAGPGRCLRHGSKVKRAAVIIPQARLRGGPASHSWSLRPLRLCEASRSVCWILIKPAVIGSTIIIIIDTHNRHMEIAVPFIIRLLIVFILALAFSSK